MYRAIAAPRPQPDEIGNRVAPAGITPVDDCSDPPVRGVDENVLGAEIAVLKLRRPFVERRRAGEQRGTGGCDGGRQRSGRLVQFAAELDQIGRKVVAEHTRLPRWRRSMQVLEKPAELRADVAAIDRLRVALEQRRPAQHCVTDVRQRRQPRVAHMEPIPRNRNRLPLQRFGERVEQLVFAFELARRLAAFGKPEDPFVVNEVRREIPALTERRDAAVGETVEIVREDPRDRCRIERIVIVPGEFCHRRAA